VLTSVIDRMVDLAALAALTTVGAAWIGARRDAIVPLVGGAVVALVLGAGALALASWWLRRTGHPRLSELRDAFDVLMRHPGLVARAFAISLLVQGGLIAANAFIGSSVGVEVPPGAWLLAWPAAKLTAYLPITVAGFGVRESALVAFLRPFDGAAGPVMAAGLLWDVVLVIGSLGGWLVLWLLPGLRPSIVGRPQTP